MGVVLYRELSTGPEVVMGYQGKVSRVFRIFSLIFRFLLLLFFTDHFFFVTSHTFDTLQQLCC